MARNNDAALVKRVLEYIVPAAGTAFPTLAPEPGNNLRRARFQPPHVRKYMRKNYMTPSPMAAKIMHQRAA
jgi:hypothetical protein